MLMAVMTAAMTSCTDMQRLKMDIKESNEDLPELISDGMLMTKIQLHGDYVEYLIYCDEIDEDGEEYSIADWNDPETKAEIKKTCLMILKILKHRKMPMIMRNCLNY